jgi:hypothetical protein
MKKLWIVFLLLILSACSKEDPKDMLSESVKKMNDLKGYHMDANAVMEMGALGFKINVNSKNHIEIESDGDSKKVLMETTQSINGNQIPTTKMFLSKDKIGSYNPNTGQWEYRVFDSNNQTDQEDKWLITQILNLYNPESAANQFLESQSDKKIETVGEKTINGVKCTGISIQIEAKEFMKQMGEILGEASGTKELSGVIETLGNNALKNTKTIYWIGNSDHYIHRYESSLSGSFGKYVIVSNVNDYNKTITIK